MRATSCAPVRPRELFDDSEGAADYASLIRPTHRLVLIRPALPVRTAAIAPVLLWRTPHCAVGAKDATVARFWLEPNTTALAVVEELAGVRCHDFNCLVPA